MKVRAAFLSIAVLLSLLMATPSTAASHILSLPSHSYAYGERYDPIGGDVRGYIHSSEEIRVVVSTSRWGIVYDNVGCDHEIVCDTWGGWMGIHLFNHNDNRVKIKYHLSVDHTEFRLRVQY